MQKYVFRKYSPKYRDFFVCEKEKLVRALGLTVKIEHVGSTAIPNLGGKGIIDIVVGISHSKLSEAKKILEKLDYIFSTTAGSPDRLFFKRDYPYRGRKRRVHIHLTKFNSKDWKEMIGFREYLLMHPEIVKQYARIKKNAVKEASGDGKRYKQFKDAFVENITKEALR
ncbi:TPA: hypothetical protein DEP90_01220 [Patescibacteria group bacterium]|nr:hypothetical protein [Patescibacteria group bacterium]